MNLTELISLILNLVFGTGFLVTFVTLKQTRQKAKSEVEKSNVDLASLSVKEMIASVNMVMSENKKLIEKQICLQHSLTDSQKRIEHLEKLTEESKQMQEAMLSVSNENRELRKRIDSLEKRVTCMTKLNRKVLDAIEKLPVDESLIKLLQEHSDL